MTLIVFPEAEPGLKPLAYLVIRGLRRELLSSLKGSNNKVKDLAIYSVIFSVKPIRTEKFLNRRIKVLGIITDRCPKGRLRKMKS